MVAASYYQPGKAPVETDDVIGSLQAAINHLSAAIASLRMGHPSHAAGQLRSAGEKIGSAETDIEAARVEASH